MKPFSSFAAIFLVCEFLTSGALVIRRSAQNQLDLSNALSALHRQRRRINENDFLQAAYNGVEDPYDPYEEYLSNKREYMVPQPYPMVDMLETYPSYLENSYNSKPSRKRNYKRSRTVPSHAELEAIFGPLSRTQDHTHKRQISVIPGYLDMPSKMKKTAKSNDGIEEDESSDKSSENLSESKIEELISEAEKEEEEENNESKEESNKKRQKEKVSSSELSNVFSPKNKDKITTATKSENVNKNDEQVPSTPASPINNKDPNSKSKSESDRFWELSSYMNLADNKKKRVAKRDYDSDIQLSQAVLDLTSEVGTLRDEVARLKLVEKLEDKENDFLASALKEATISQLQENDNYLHGEYKDIEKAIQVEEMLQAIKSDEPVGDDSEIPDDKSKDSSLSDSVEENTEKRDNNPNEGVDKPFEDNMGKWYESPVIVDDDNNELSNGESQKVLRGFVQEVLNNQEDDGTDDQNDVALETYMRELSPEDRERIEEEIISATNTENEDECPNIENLSTNCEVADTAGLAIDEDARRLCKRHELCYVCGETLGIDQLSCDTGYRRDVVSMCGHNTDCIKNGARFLWFIKAEHRYNEKYIDQCREVCVRDYIVDL